VLFQSVFVFVENAKRRRNIFIIVSVLMILTWYTNLGDAHIYSKYAQLLLLPAFFVFVMIALFRLILKAKKVTLDILIVSISNYLIIGIVAGALFYLSYLAKPATSFRIPADIQPAEFTDFVYFAYVTQATLGYGDISPASRETMTLSALVAIIGQFYVAVLVAFLVSKFVMHSEDAGQKD
jgi:uncharacterized membrane protein